MAEAEVAEQEKPEVEAPVVALGGEVHIVVDAKDGSIKISSPPNLMWALGILETAKFILVQQRQENIAAQHKPVIRPATEADLESLKRAKTQH